MSSVALVFSALAALSASPVAAPSPGAVAPPPALATPAPPQGICGSQKDPQFVRFVPGAPSTGGDSLLRRVAYPPADQAAAPSSREATRCLRMLKRADLPR
jgi:hypothetical protein